MSLYVLHKTFLQLSQDISESSEDKKKFEMPVVDMKRQSEDFTDKEALLDQKLSQIESSYEVKDEKAPQPKRRTIEAPDLPILPTVTQTLDSSSEKNLTDANQSQTFNDKSGDHRAQETSKKKAMDFSSINKKPVAHPDFTQAMSSNIENEMRDLPDGHYNKLEQQTTDDGTVLTEVSYNKEEDVFSVNSKTSSDDRQAAYRIGLLTMEVIVFFVLSGYLILTNKYYSFLPPPPPFPPPPLSKTLFPVRKKALTISYN